MQRIERTCPKCGMRGGPRLFRYDVDLGAYTCRNKSHCASRVELTRLLAQDKAARRG